MSNPWMNKLRKLDGAILENENPFKAGIQTFSPSVNFIFGKTHLMPFGYTALVSGTPGGGKSVLLHMAIGHLHQTDPEAIAIKIDTEYRSKVQLTEDMLKVYGIDTERLLIIQTNNPSTVFDQTDKDIRALCQAGAPIKLIGIDSVSGIQGRREMQSESVEKMTIGDHAQTLQIGLKRILPVIRDHNIALFLIAQARAEMDQTEIMRGNKVRMDASFGLRHMAEYFISVEENRTKAGRTDISGNEFVDDTLTDLADKGEITAKKIRVKMKKNSIGPSGRTAEFTFSFKHGVVNQNEEVFKLGVNRGIINTPNQVTYAFGGETWRGKEACVKGLAESPATCNAIIAELIRRDAGGEYEAVDRELAKSEGEDE